MTEETNISGKTAGINWSQVLTAVFITAIVSIGGTFIALNVKMAHLEEQIKSIKENPNTNQVTDNSSPKVDSIVKKVSPSDLQDIIKSKQRQKVNPSYDEYNCFTDVDLQNFRKNNTPEQAVNELIEDNSFIDLIIAIKDMNPADRQKLLATSSNIAKPTWATLGSNSIEGQTEAGHEAELLIAKAIVSKIKEMVKLSDDDLKKKYQ